MNPVFSIITVSYNAADHIESTILSIAGQTYDKIEYIIIDGDSTDETVNIIKKHEQHISYWVSEPDNGLYDAMNKGLQKATGDYVWFMNAGDCIYDRNTVDGIVALLSESEKKPEIIYGETAIIDKKGMVIRQRRLKAPEKLTWKSFKMGMLVSHQSFIARRETAPLFDTDYRYSADVDWCIKCLKQAMVISNTHLILSKYLDEGLTTANRKASLRERYDIMCKYYGKLPTMIRHIWFGIRFYTTKLLTGKI